MKRDTNFMAVEITRISDGLRSMEPELMKLKWFDYRFMTPLRATCLFACVYNRSYGEFIAKTRDIDESKYWRGVDINQHLISFWRGRQAADTIGCRYDYYVRSAFERVLDHGWRYLPQPNQLYSEQLVLEVGDKWSELKKNVLQLANGDIYRAENYVGLPEQRAYHDYLIEQVRQRALPCALLSSVLSANLLPASVATKAFTRDELTKAIDFCRC